MKVTVVYPVTFDIKNALDEKLWKKIKTGKPKPIEILLAQKTILDFAGKIFESSSVKPVIQDCEIPELVM